MATGYMRAGTGPARIESTRLSWSDLLGEALAGLSQRPTRTILTMLGTVIAVGAFVTILGLTATTAGQVSGTFSKLSATQVVVNDVGGRSSQTDVYSFPAQADAVVSRLNGVVHAGVSWPVGIGPSNVTTSLDPRAAVTQLQVIAASPGYLAALDSTLSSGVLYNSFHEDRGARVAVLGGGAARRLGISSVANEPAIFIGNVSFTVVGILGNVQREPGALLSVLIPATVAQAFYGDPTADNPASMLIETKLGAAQLIARQAPIALRPDDPTVLRAVSPPDSQSLKTKVAGSLNSLFLILAAVTLAVGAVGIANTTLVAVLERTSEIGLRRAVGARPRHIGAQFLAETTTLGTLGGLVGTGCGIVIVVLTALANSWTALLAPVPTMLAPLIGTFTGLLAGFYPAVRAARIEPLEALRR